MEPGNCPYHPPKYRANGYKLSFEKLMDKTPSDDSSQVGPELTTRRKRRSRADNRVGEVAVSDDIRDQDRRDLSGSRHGASSGA